MTPRSTLAADFWLHSGTKEELNQGHLHASDESLWNITQRGSQRLAKQLARSGSRFPQLLLAGGGLFMTLSNWGLLPQVGLVCSSNPIVCSALWTR